MSAQDVIESGTLLNDLQNEDVENIDMEQEFSLILSKK